jgi:4-hydroxy-tetrahydrodipicolinate synthase
MRGAIVPSLRSAPALYRVTGAPENAAIEETTTMTTQLAFEGVYPILATPFDENENLDLESFGRLVRFMAGLGVDGITVLGVLGEANRLLDGERAELIRTAVAAAGAMPVIVGASHSGTRAATELAQMAEKLGANAVMVTPHAEAVPNDDRVFEYYRSIADGIRIPIVAQDHPASTQVHMTVALLLRIIREVPQVASIKEEAVPTAAKIHALAAGMKERKVPILTGLGALYGLFDLQAGSAGFNTGFAFPEVLLAMVNAARAGNWARVQEIYTRFLPLIVFEQQPGVAIRKEILRLRGAIKTSKVRHPGADLQPATVEQLRKLLDALFPGQDLSRPVSL